jgi:proline iminopeptidase
MRKICAIGLFIWICSSGIAVFSEEPNGLWPKLAPHRTGYLQVSPQHEIYYKLGGTPKGMAVMVLHGGPGAGCGPEYFRYFDPEKFHVVLHDQRGCGLSRPYGGLYENDTWHLVDDIEKLRRHLGLGKVLLFGGSWGSTLALAYAETYPGNVAGMILRGVFTASREEIDHFYHGGAGKFFPETYAALQKAIDRPQTHNYPEQFLAKLRSPDPLVREQAAWAWTRYESKLAFLNISDDEINKWLQGYNPFAFALLESHYMANRCFLEEGQLLKNAGRIAAVPTVIINGRYDVICPPHTAYRLHGKLAKSRLVIVDASGHSSSEAGIRAALLQAARDFEKNDFAGQVNGNVIRILRNK